MGRGSGQTKPRPFPKSIHVPSYSPNPSSCSFLVPFPSLLLPSFPTPRLSLPFVSFPLLLSFSPHHIFLLPFLPSLKLIPLLIIHYLLYLYLFLDMPGSILFFSSCIFSFSFHSLHSFTYPLDSLHFNLPLTSFLFTSFSP